MKAAKHRVVHLENDDENDPGVLVLVSPGPHVWIPREEGEVAERVRADWRDALHGLEEAVPEDVMPEYHFDGSFGGVLVVDVAAEGEGAVGVSLSVERPPIEGVDDPHDIAELDGGDVRRRILDDGPVDSMEEFWHITP